MKIIPPGKQLSSLVETDWFEVNPFKNQNTFFPRSINLEDIDKAVYDWFKETDIIINDKDLSVFFLTPEKWAEFKKQWKYSDGDRNVDYPYVTIRRSSVGPSSDSTKARVPFRKFTTYRIPYYTPSGPTYKLYKVPQPVKIDLEYEIRALTHYISDINLINETMLRHFASLQEYLNIDGHYMKMRINSVSDETNYDDIESERVLNTTYSIIVNGYLIDEKEFEEKLGVTSILVNIEEDVS